MPPMKFRDLFIGQEFDFVSGHIGYDSFYKRCVRISERKYKDEDGLIHRVGSINCYVYNLS